MKSYFIGSLAILALSLGSCSNDDSLEQQLDDKSAVPMTFAVSQEPFTRITEINSVDQLDSFYLWAQTGGQQYFKDSFSKVRTPSNTTPVYYTPDNLTDCTWPENGTAVVDFYATNEFEKFIWQDSITNKQLELYNADFTDKDLIFAYSHYESTPADGKVTLSFHHVMAELGILLKGELPTGRTNIQYEVTDIYVIGDEFKVLNLGKLTEENCWDTSEIAESSVISYYTEGSFEVNTTDYTEPHSSTAAVVDKDSYLFMIPGTYTIEVTYSSTDMDTKAGGSTTKRCEVTLTKGKVNVIKITLPFFMGEE